MFEHIGRRIFLEQPAGKDPAPAFAVIGPRRALVNRHADKSALIGIGFPRGGAFTGADEQRHFAKANRFAGFQFKIAGLAVAFVEQANHRDPLCHWRAGLVVYRRSRASGRSFVFCSRALLGRLIASLLVASGKRQRRGQQQGQPLCHHAASGLHA
jgi:hypothetical protein